MGDQIMVLEGLGAGPGRAVPRIVKQPPALAQRCPPPRPAPPPRVPASAALERELQAAAVKIDEADAAATPAKRDAAAHAAMEHVARAAKLRVRERLQTQVAKLTRTATALRAWGDVARANLVERQADEVRAADVAVSRAPAVVPRREVVARVTGPMCPSIPLSGVGDELDGFGALGVAKKGSKTKKKKKKKTTWGGGLKQAVKSAAQGVARANTKAAEQAALQTATNATAAAFIAAAAAQDAAPLPDCPPGWTATPAGCSKGMLTGYTPAEAADFDSTKCPPGYPAHPAVARECIDPVLSAKSGGQFSVSQEDAWKSYNASPAAQATAVQESERRRIAAEIKAEAEVELEKLRRELESARAQMTTQEQAAAQQRILDLERKAEEAARQSGGADDSVPMWVWILAGILGVGGAAAGAVALAR